MTRAVSGSTPEFQDKSFRKRRIELHRNVWPAAEKAWGAWSAGCWLGSGWLVLDADYAAVQSGGVLNVFRTKIVVVLDEMIELVGREPAHSQHMWPLEPEGTSTAL